MRQLDHPNVCGLLNAYESPRAGFFVLEFCEGGELFDRLLSGGRFTETIAACVIKQVALAIQHSHACGIAHRDLKPENICFVSKNPDNMHVKVIDWGLASNGQLTGLKSSVGSPEYAAPEVVNANESRRYTSACDIWSVGMMTYVMLSAKLMRPDNRKQLMDDQSDICVLTGAPWDTVGKEAHDFVVALMKAAPDARPSIDNVLQHPFLTNGSKELACELGNGGTHQSVLDDSGTESRSPTILTWLSDFAASICAPRLPAMEM